MPRTRAKTKKDPNDPPLYRWSKLARHDKLICWNYFQYTATDGEEGWNPSNAGSVDHYRISNYIQSLGSASWFRHRAKLMVTLAQVFAARNEAPPNPNTAAAAPAPADPAGAEPATGGAPPRPQPNPEAFTTTATATAGMNSPNPRRGTPSRPGTPSVPGSIGVPAGEISNHEEENDAQCIPCPTCFGAHDTFDYATRKSSKHLLARTLLHNAVTIADLTFVWITPRRLKFSIAWPDFFQFAEQMAAMTTDTNNNMLFPPEHSLTMDTSRRNQERVEEDGRVWDDGVFSFDQDMKDENPVIELVDVFLPDRNIYVKCLQVYAE